MIQKEDREALELRRSHLERYLQRLLQLDEHLPSALLSFIEFNERHSGMRSTLIEQVNLKLQTEVDFIKHKVKIVGEKPTTYFFLRVKFGQLKTDSLEREQVCLRKTFKDFKVLH